MPASGSNLCRRLAAGVPLEYSLEWLTCAFASKIDVVMVGLPDATQDHLPAHVPVVGLAVLEFRGDIGEGC
jgi:hypothetical protein